MTATTAVEEIKDFAETALKFKGRMTPGARAVTDELREVVRNYKPSERLLEILTQASGEKNVRHEAAVNS